ncbi:MAG TPA: universal stress protein [Casimicrobiaceae bacterium]|jgi:nucleotide-binding universal stress UspA family protein|nr:universal stress protein [Casimicrobiaceae bacterium]
MFKHILVPTDGSKLSQKAVEEALETPSSRTVAYPRQL